MAGSGVTLYAATSAGNKAIVGMIDWRENIYTPSQINDNLAQIMADIRAMMNNVANGWVEFGDGDGVYTATYVSATSFRFDGVDVTAYYRAGMRVRVIAPTPGSLTGTITTSVFSTHTTITCEWDAGSLSNEAITAVQIGVGSGGGGAVTTNSRNLIGRNGGLEVWQRGAGGSAGIAVAASSSLYTADGWVLTTGASQASAAFQTNGITTGSRYGAAVQRVAGQTGVTAMLFEFPMDTDEIVPARGSYVSLGVSFQAGANFSPAGGVVNVLVVVGSGAPAKRSLGAYTGEVAVISSTAVVTATARRLTFTSATGGLIVPTNTTQASVMFSWTPVGTAGAADYVTIDDVQLNVGAVAPFERRAFSAEMLDCKRHYQKSFDYAIAPAAATGTVGMGAMAQAVPASTGQFTDLIPLAPVMRSSPTLGLYNPYVNNSQVRNVNTATDCTGSAGYIGNFNGFNLNMTTPAGSAAGNLLAFHWHADAGI